LRLEALTFNATTLGGGCSAETALGELAKRKQRLAPP
jgi:hypothetical protein